LANNKLIQALSSFSKGDWIDFRKFVLTKTGADSEHFALYSQIQKQKKDLPNKEGLEHLRSKYFFHKTVKGYSNMLSQLFQWCEEWLVINQLYKDRYQADLILLKSLNRRGLFTLANQTANRLEKKILSSEKLDLAKNSALTELYHQQFYSDNPIKYKSGTELLQNLQSTYLRKTKEELLLYACEFENWATLKNLDFERVLSSIDQILAYCPGSNESELLLDLKELIQTSNFEKLKKIKDKLFIPVIDQSSDLHVIVYMYLFTMAIRILNQGKLKQTQILFELYDYGFNRGLLMNSGKIPELRFETMVNVLANMKSEKETEKMILKWYSQVNSKNPEATKLLALAQNKIYHKSYKDIVSLLHNFEFSHYGKLKALAMISIAYYEEGESDMLHHHLENFVRTLKRNKLKMNKTLFLSYLNFYKLQKILLKADVHKAQINLSEYTHLIFRSWLMEKLITKHGIKKSPE